MAVKNAGKPWLKKLIIHIFFSSARFLFPQHLFNTFLYAGF